MKKFKNNKKWLLLIKKIVLYATCILPGLLYTMEPSAITPAGFDFYIKQSFNLLDQEDFQLCLEYLHTPNLTSISRNKALGLLQDLDLRGFCPAQHFLYFLYLRGMFGIQRNYEIAEYYLQRAIAFRYTPAIFTHVENLLQYSARTQWAPLYNENGKVYSYRPCYYEPATLLNQQLNYVHWNLQQRNKILVEQYQHYTDNNNIEINSDKATTNSNQNITNENITTTITTILKKDTKLDENNKNKSEAQETTSLQPDSEKSTIQEAPKRENKWKIFINTDENYDLIDILQAFQKSINQQEDILDLCHQMNEAGIFPLLEEKSRLSSQASYIYGSIIYDLSIHASSRVMKFFREHNVFKFTGPTLERKHLKKYAYSHLLKAGSLQNPCVFLLLSELAHAEKTKLQFLCKAYMCSDRCDTRIARTSSPESVREFVLDSLNRKTDSNNVNAIGSLLSLYLNKPEEHLEHIVSLIYKLRQSLNYIDDKFMKYYQLFDRLDTLAKNSSSLELKYVTGLLFYRLNYSSFQLEERYHYIAKALLTEARHYSTEALYQTLGIFISSKKNEDVQQAISWFVDETSHENLTKKSPKKLKSFFELCKNKAHTNAHIGLLVAQVLSAGLSTIIKQNRQEAEKYLLGACSKGSGKIVQKILDTLILEDLKYEDTPYVVKACTESLKSYIEKSSNRPIQEEKWLEIKTKLSYILQTFPLEPRLQFTYDLVKVILPYDPDFATAIFSQVEKTLYNSVSKSRDTTIHLAKNIKQIITTLETYAKKNAQLAINLQEALFWRLIFDCWLEKRSVTFNKIHKLLFIAEKLDPKIINFEETKATIDLKEGLFALQNNDFEKALSCLRKAKSKSVLARAIYADLLLDVKNKPTQTYEQFYQASVEIEDALLHLTEEELNHISHTLYKFGCFYLEPPIVSFNGRTFQNKERGLQLLKMAASYGEKAAQELLEITNSLSEKTIQEGIFKIAHQLFSLQRYNEALEKFKTLPVDHPEALAYCAICQFELQQNDEAVATSFNYLEKAFADTQKIDYHLISTVINYLLGMTLDDPKAVYNQFGPVWFNKVLSFVIQCASTSPDDESSNWIHKITSLFELSAALLIDHSSKEESENPCDGVRTLLQNNLIHNFSNFIGGRESSTTALSGFLNPLLALHAKSYGYSNLSKINEERRQFHNELLEEIIHFIGLIPNQKTLSEETREIISQIYWLHGELYEKKKNISQALKSYNKSLHYNNKNPFAFFRRANIFLINFPEKNKQALRDLEKSAQYNYKKAQVLLGNLLIYGCARIGKEIKIEETSPLKGLSWLKEAVRGDEQHPEALYALGHVYLYGTKEIKTKLPLAYEYLKKAYETYGFGDPFNYGVAALEYSKKSRNAKNYLHESVSAFLKSEDPLAKLFLSQLFITLAQDNITLNEGLNQFENFIERFKLGNDSINHLKKTDIHQIIEDINKTELSGTKDYLLALKTFKIALFYSSQPHEVKSFEDNLELTQKFLISLRSVKKEDERFCILYSALYAGYYFLSLLAQENKFTDEQLIRLAMNHLKKTIAGFNTDGTCKYPALEIRFNEIKTIISLITDKKPLLAQFYDDILADELHKANITILEGVFTANS